MAEFRMNSKELSLITLVEKLIERGLEVNS